jgi:hypothetical protein
MMTRWPAFSFAVAIKKSAAAIGDAPLAGSVSSPVQRFSLESAPT